MRDWTIDEWRAAFRRGDDLKETLLALADALPRDDTAWITVAPRAHLGAQAEALLARAGASPDSAAFPLYGVPFAVKDNIDVAGLPTTAGCPAFAYTPTADATVVARLRAAGAIVIGKSNLDQFATGLVGVRSPYGAVPNSFNPDYVSGGSSSGSASLVARGLVPFALGTDTAGSGRVPAGLNNIVGIKPTRGAFSNHGVVPACRTLDCVTVFGTTVEDVARVYRAAAGFDAADGFSRHAPLAAKAWQLPARPRFGIPATLEFYGDAAAGQAFADTLARLAAQGAEFIPLDFSVFDDVAALLYDGPWIAERYAAIETFAAAHEAAIHPVVRDIIFQAKRFSATDYFHAAYRLGDLARSAEALMAQVDALLVPTAPTHYRIADVEAQPVELNSRLGKYTNFVNLLDWSALALPATLRADGLPFGVTLIGPAWHELALAEFGQRWQATLDLPRGATGLPYSRAALPDAGTTGAVGAVAASGAVASATAISAANAATSSGPAVDFIRVAVVGAHLAGMPLNRELTERAAQFVERTATAPSYRLYALARTVPPKPGLVRSAVAGEGAPIEVELWDVPAAAFGSFVAGVPGPLGIGTLELLDGRLVKGFICEPYALADARDITAFGGWRAFIQGGGASAPAAG